jgi:hypothetical protein
MRTVIEPFRSAHGSLPREPPSRAFWQGAPSQRRLKCV